MVAVDAAPARGIVTPEAVVLQFELAGIGSRVLAQAVDVGVRVGVLYGVFLVVALAGGVTDEATVVIVTIVSSFVLLFGYPALLEALWRGQTVGKRVLGLRVVTTEGAPVRFRHTAVRALLAVVDFALPPVGVTATLSALLSRRGQRLGDLFAGTIVLREGSGAGMPIPVSFPPPPGYEAYARSLDVGALTPEQYALVRSFLLRVHQLRPEARARLAVRLANPIALAMHHQPPATVTPEAFLVSVAAAYQLRLGGPPVPLPPWVSTWG